MTGQIVDTSNPSALHDAVVDFFHTHEAEYEVRVQLCTSLETMPIEDVSVEWSEEESLYRVVGKITLPVQETYCSERLVYADDTLTFNP